MALLELKQCFFHGLKILVYEETRIFKKGIKYCINCAITLCFGCSEPLPWGWTLANMLIFRKIKEASGFNKCALALVGAAPMHRETLEFLMSVDIPVCELYGMSECTGPQTVNLKSATQWRSGSCGKGISGVETTIDNPDSNGNGEVSDHVICIRVTPSSYYKFIM